MYVATHTRSDIMYVTSYLSRYLNKPMKQLWTAVKRVLRYLKETKHLSLLYTQKRKECIYAYSDTDWGKESEDRKRMSGSASFHVDNLVSWFSQKQKCVAFSTAESE